MASLLEELFSNHTECHPSEWLHDRGWRRSGENRYKNINHPDIGKVNTRWLASHFVYNYPDKDIVDRWLRRKGLLEAEIRLRLFNWEAVND